MKTAHLREDGVNEWRWKGNSRQYSGSLPYGTLHGLKLWYTSWIDMGC